MTFREGTLNCIGFQELLFLVIGLHLNLIQFSFYMGRFCLLLCVFCSSLLFATTYTTTGANTWDANGAPPSGWLGDGTVIIISHAITNMTTYDFQIYQTTASLTINNGGRWDIQSVNTANTPTFDINSGGKLFVSNSISLSGGTFNLDYGGLFRVSGSSALNSGTFNVDGNFTSVGNVANAMTINCTGAIHYGAAWSGTLPGCATLPVELISFEGFEKDATNILNWTTASEINSKEFQLLRSGNGINFETITSINAAGNSNIWIDYSFIDNNPLNGINYYQLIETDQDGAQQYSKIISIDQTSAFTSFTLYPNPSSAFSTLSFYSEMDQSYQLRIFDILGKSILTKTFSGFTGQNFFPISTENLSEGSYQVIITSAQNKSNSFLLIKTK